MFLASKYFDRDVSQYRPGFKEEIQNEDDSPRLRIRRADKANRWCFRPPTFDNRSGNKAKDDSLRHWVGRCRSNNLRFVPTNDIEPPFTSNLNVDGAWFKPRLKRLERSGVCGGTSAEGGHPIPYIWNGQNSIPWIWTCFKHCTLRNQVSVFVGGAR